MTKKQDMSQANSKGASHTPGPWVVSPGRPHRIETDMGFVVAEAFGPAWGKEADEANARLIAAAPELLQGEELNALTMEGVADTLERGGGYAGTVAALRKAVEATRARVAKAEGRTNA